MAQRQNRYRCSKRSHRLLCAGIVALSWSAIAAAHCATFTEGLVVLQNNVVNGSLDARTHDCTTEVEYRLSENGRGPQTAETIKYGSRHLPIEHRVQGGSEFGAKVDELFRREGQGATWRSQADAGNVADARGRLYLVKDFSPYSSAVYARALLASPHGTLSTLPGGELRITKLGTRRFLKAGLAESVAFYRIEGSNAAPDYVAFDRQMRLFATFSALPDIPASVRKGWEPLAPAIVATFRKFNEAHLASLQRQLAHGTNLPIRIHDVRIFDSRTGTLTGPSDLIVKAGHIAAILPTATAMRREKELLVEGNGGTLVPGLHDMHAHYTQDAGLLYLAAGITTIRDMGNDNDFLLSTVAKLKDRVLPGPDIVYNGFLEGKSPYSANLGILVDNLDEALNAVRWYKAHGYFQIKLYNSFHAEWVPATAALAHQLGMTLTGHVPAFSTPDQMIDAGYDELTHSNQLLLGWLIKPGEDSRTQLRQTAIQRAADLDLSSPKVRATIEHMRRKNIPLDTTVTIREQLMMSRAGAVPPSFAPVIDHLPVMMRRRFTQTWMPINSADQDAQWRKAFAKLIDVVRLLHTNDVQLLPGTDDGEGFALDRELELYQQAGMTPAEVLSNATLGMARYLHRDADHGTIEVGKAADMFLIAGDPTKTVSAVRSPSIVFKGNVYYLPEEIYRTINIAPFASPPNIVQH